MNNTASLVIEYCNNPQVYPRASSRLITDECIKYILIEHTPMDLRYILTIEVEIRDDIILVSAIKSNTKVPKEWEKTQLRSYSEFTQLLSRIREECRESTNE